MQVQPRCQRQGSRKRLTGMRRPHTHPAGPAGATMHLQYCCCFIHVRKGRLMCGRFAFYDRLQIIEKYIGRAIYTFAAFKPKYNIAPTHWIPVIREDEDGDRTIDHMQWGLIPHWSKERPKRPLINARSETAATKPSFRTAFKKQRCLIPASGFYEWQTVAGTAQNKPPKQPWFIRAAEPERPLFLAGLWERWHDPEPSLTNPDNEPILTCTILTTEANALMHPIHDRMPVILTTDTDLATWLDVRSKPIEEIQRLAHPCDDGFLTTWPVSRLVNNPRTDSPDLIQRVDADR